MPTSILSYPDYVGEGWSRTSSSTEVDGGALRLPGTLALDVDRKLTPGVSWGSRALPQVRTRGKAEFSAKLTLLQRDYEQLCPYLIAKGGGVRGLFEVPFHLTCTVFEFGLGTVIWEVLAARIMDESTSPVKDGDDGVIQTALDLSVMNILKNGLGIVIEQTPFGQTGV